MRQYLYVFWAIVLLGMLLLTAAYPEARQQELFTGWDHYYLYDSDGSRACLSRLERWSIQYSAR
jgi:hypothetical protein